MESKILNNNALAFIALSNEYCHALETASAAEPVTFIDTMLRLLPRLYISATDLDTTGLVVLNDEDVYIESSLDEEYYESVRAAVAALMGGEDVYLETFEEDMKYSDTPVSASISEGLADIFQVLYNFTGMVKNRPTDMLPGVLTAVKDDFGDYWSRPLCNVLRALNHVRYSGALSDGGLIDLDE